MADIAPLWPLRYDAALLEKVVAPPYDVIDAKLRQELGARHPHNVVHVDLPEGDGDKKYERAQGLFTEWQELGVVIRDEAPAYWRYAQTFTPPGGGEPITRKGFFALVRAVPFSDRVVLPHERTLKGPKLDRIQLSRATRAALSPQFMLYSDPERRLDALLDSGELFAEFKTTDGIQHRIWRVTSRAAIDAITTAMAERTLLIADGHHRYETSVAISEEFEAEAKERGVQTSPRSEHRFTYALLANGDDPSLVVFPTHRLVHSLPKFDWSELVTQSRVLFDVAPAAGSAEELRARLLQETRPALCAMAAGGKAALLTLRKDADLAGHPVLGKRPAVLRDTAVALLHDGLLEYVLGISPEAQAQKTNLKYLQDPSTGAAMLEAGEGQVLFLMNGTPVSTVRQVAEAGEVMPQKSTFFYPKVPTGLCFHTLYPDRLVP
jgi:uncharacterized protein (DUF1015 family)